MTSRLAFQDRTSLAMLALLAVLLLLGTVFSIAAPQFLSARNLSMLLIEFSMTSVLALGMLLLILPGHIDLSAGSGVGLLPLQSHEEFEAEIRARHGRKSAFWAYVNGTRRDRHDDDLSVRRDVQQPEADGTPHLKRGQRTLERVAGDDHSWRARRSAHVRGTGASRGDRRGRGCVTRRPRGPCR